MLAGEIYTTFTFLGGSGYAYGFGAPVYHLLAYGTPADVISCFPLPPVWAYAKWHSLHSQPDFFTGKFSSPALGFFMWPHSFAACYSAHEAKVFRRNAIVLPIYQLILLFAFFVGFAVVLEVPGLKGADTHLALFHLVVKESPPAVVGIVGAAGIFTALVTGSLIAMAAAMLLAKNLIGLAWPGVTDHQMLTLAKWLVPVIMLVAVYFTLSGNSTIVTMLPVGYSFVTQLFPVVVASVLPRPLVTTPAAFLSILTGVVVAAILTFTHTGIGHLAPGLPEPIRDLNIGITALAANIVVLVVVTARTRQMRTAAAV